ncbi:hypothetical protein Xbed_02645 [Xenorhabdus beddingii]|uniref:Uncharacterized protein n=1 Tax=Xenorhabdus beddingii TaxID=40578 RepID=A0A1Y2SKR8_9GAMM|nr:hypothetical protein Xbed_02645 [Xenorhabdus beddingii]
MAIVFPQPQRAATRGEPLQPVMAVVAQPQAAVLFIKQFCQPLMAVILPGPFAPLIIFGGNHQPEFIAGQGRFAAIRGNKAFRIAPVVIVLLPNPAERIGHADETVRLIILVTPGGPRRLRKGRHQSGIRQIVQGQDLPFRQDFSAQVAPVIVLKAGHMTARGFFLRHQLLVIMAPRGDMPVGVNHPGQTRFVFQYPRIIAPAAHGINTAPLRIIAVIHRRLVTVMPAANQPLGVIVIEQVKVLSTVCVGQPAIFVITITRHHGIQAVVGTANFCQQSVVPVQQYQRRAVTVRHLNQLMLFTVMKRYRITERVRQGSQLPLRAVLIGRHPHAEMLADRIIALMQHIPAVCTAQGKLRVLRVHAAAVGRRQDKVKRRPFGSLDFHPVPDHHRPAGETVSPVFPQ